MKSKYAPIGAKLIQNPDLQQRVGSAVWLFLYLVLNRDWKTGTLNRRVETMADDLKRNRKQIQRWLRTLEDEGLIITRRQRYGYLIEIPNRFVMGQECPNTTGESWDKSGPVMGQIRTSDGTIQDQRDAGVPSLSNDEQRENSESLDTNVPSLQSLYQESLNKTPPNPPMGGTNFSDPESEKKWEAVKELVNKKILPENFKTWFEPTVGLVVQPNRVLVAVPNRFYKKCLEENYKSEVRGALLEVGGFDSPPVPEFFVMEETEVA